MTQLPAWIEQEQPCIQAALNKAAASLPDSVRPVVDHVFGHGGKRLRPLLTLFTARLYGCTHEDVYALASAVEMFHTATLMHDDIIDNATMRRGQPAAHQVFGITKTILAGDALLAGGNSLVASCNNAHLSAVAAEAIARTAGGEILEIDHQGVITPDLSTYIDIATGKTAWMIRAACSFGVIRAGVRAEQEQAAGDYGLNLGIAFQMVDDALDFAPSADTGKPEGGDLREGKLTPPIFFYYNSLSSVEQQKFSRAFHDHTFSDAEVNAISAAIREKGFADQARRLADRYLERAGEALEKMHYGLPDSPELRTLYAFIAHVRNRET